MDLLIQFLGTYYLIGLGLMVMFLCIDRPRLSWKWLVIPLLACAWPVFVWKAASNYNRPW